MPERVSGATQSVSKLDPSLRLQQLSLGREIGNAHESDSAPRAVSVFVTFKGSVSTLERCNMTVNSYDGVVATGAIPLTDLHRLEALEEVEWVSLAARVWPLIDRSIPEIKATDLRFNAPPYVSAAGPTAYTGKGVLVGVIDDRINLFHRSFMKPNPDKTIQVTRIVAIWDHYAIPDPAKGQGPPPGFTGNL